MSFELLTRSNLRSLADLRLKEANCLLAGGFYSGAYYIAGYAAELGLKACIAKLFKAEVIPDSRLVERAKSHVLIELVALAQLKVDLDARIASDLRFETNWELVQRWRPNDRYRMVSDVEAIELIKAFDESTHGVMEWIRTHW